MERHFEKELETLRADLVKMGNLVDDQLDMAFEALFSGDVQKAKRVIEGDSAINLLDNAIQKQCQKIFALNQPVAIDLRLLMSSLNINQDLERMGDIAVNIAERVDSLSDHVDFLKSTRLQEMSRIAQIMVRDSLDAFINNHPPLAVRVLESDDVVDTFNKNIFFRMIRSMKSDNGLIEPASHILILSRHLERLADHATNIAEDAIFLVEAKIVKHHALADEG